MKINNDKELLESYILGQVTDEEKKIIEQRLSADKEYKKEYEDLLALSESIDDYEKYRAKKLFLQKLEVSFSEKKYFDFNQISNYKYAIGIAASVLLLITINNFFLKDKIANTEDSFLGEPLELDSTYNDSLKSDTIIVIRK